MDRCHELLDAMIAAGVQKRMEWTAQTHVHFVDHPLLSKMKVAGSWRIGMGIETGDTEVLKRTGKGSTPEMILKAGAAAKQAKLPIETYFILGHPNETIESMKRTIDLAVKLNPETPIFGVMVPSPGTEIGRMAAAGEGGYRLRLTDWDDYDKQIGGALEFASLTRNQIERLQLWAYTKVFLFNGRCVDFVRLSCDTQGRHVARHQDSAAPFRQAGQRRGRSRRLEPAARARADRRIDPRLAGLAEDRSRAHQETPSRSEQRRLRRRQKKRHEPEPVAAADR